MVAKSAEPVCFQPTGLQNRVFSLNPTLSRRYKMVAVFAEPVSNDQKISSSPSPVPLQPTWIQDGGCVCRTGSQ